MKYILVGSHDTERQNRDHMRSLARGICDYVVAPTINEAESLIKNLRLVGEKYFAIFNMNVLNREEVDKSKLIELCEKNAILSYNHRLPRAAWWIKMV